MSEHMDRNDQGFPPPDDKASLKRQLACDEREPTLRAGEEFIQIELYAPLLDATVEASAVDDDLEQLRQSILDGTLEIDERLLDEDFEAEVSEAQELVEVTPRTDVVYRLAERLSEEADSRELLGRGTEPVSQGQPAELQEQQLLDVLQMAAVVPTPHFRAYVKAGRRYPERKPMSPGRRAALRFAACVGGAFAGLVPVAALHGTDSGSFKLALTLAFTVLIVHIGREVVARYRRILEFFAQARFTTGPGAEGEGLDGAQEVARRGRRETT
ncbi:hypothetical protein ACFWJ5_41680 [Streptomyces qaidamensis]|uniref:hypothetical protein n=1 Tax=Streptomyces qaidamensis TaxID=1783515 RepID=UPI0036480C20